MAEKTVKSEIERLKQNVTDSYDAIEQNRGKIVIDEHNSDYINDNISEMGRHVQAVVTDETVTMDLDLDEYEIIDLTNLDGNLQDKVITQNGKYTYDAGYTGLRDVTVALNLDEKPDVITRDGVYVSSDDDLGGYTKVVVEYDITNQDKTITENGVYTKDAGYDGLGTVTVNLPLDSKTIEHNGTYNASSDNLEGYTSVNVQVPIGAKPTVITRNGTYNASSDNLDGYSRVQVNYDTHNQNKTVTSNGSVTFDSGYDGLGTVTVNLPLDSKTITTNGAYYPSEDDLEGYNEVIVDVPLDSKTIQHNGTYHAVEDDLEGYDVVAVNVPLGAKTITRNGTYNASSDNLDGYNKVVVDYDFRRQNKTVTTNGTYTFDSGYDGLGTVTVDYAINRQNKTVTANGTYTYDAGYDGLGTVTVAIGEDSTPYKDYLDEIEAVLIDAGYTPPSTYAGYANCINNILNDIHNRLDGILGQDEGE